ncbi:MAG: hypothetical protein IJH50_09535 [Kiritimatiellae bacterium]|nr:hypothetical protein [Kiritimatiellia bacterium]
MNFEEFLRDDEPPVDNEEEVISAAVPDELVVQKTVVESLAAEKAEQEEQINALKAKVQELEAENAELKSRADALQAKTSELEKTAENAGDLLAKNSEREESSQIALIDRNVNIDDRFPGETRDHVIEVIREARDAAEKDGRLRKAQLLESVLVANEPNGELAKRREFLEKLFEENGNIISGKVLDYLKKEGISHKNGEEYLLPAEILKRTY